MEQERVQGLDGLRAFAALAVFAVHFNQIVNLETKIGPFDLARLFENGEYGVSLFFTLSGFLISIPYWQAIWAKQKLPNLYHYLIRRAARILPAYYLCLTVLIMLSGLWKYPQMYADIVLHYLFLFNYTEFTIFSINAPFWSIAVEAQFYIVMPVIFTVIQKIKNGLCSIFFIASLGGVFYFLHVQIVQSIDQIIGWPFNSLMIWIRPYGAVLNYSLIAHLPHFLLGIMVAYLYLKKEAISATNTKKQCLVYELVFYNAFIALLLIAGTEINDYILVPYGRYGFPLVPLLLAVLVFCTPYTFFSRKYLESFPLRHTGKISYGIYLYHLPCLIFIDRLLSQNEINAQIHYILFAISSLLMTVICAYLSYVLFEQPVLRLMRSKVKR